MFPLFNCLCTCSLTIDFFRIRTLCILKLIIGPYDDGRKKSGNDKRQEALVIRPPLNAVPFSDEWLAAFEAAGEVLESHSGIKILEGNAYYDLTQSVLQEILMMKGGAVQNSPQDKSLPEPGPWSPVRSYILDNHFYKPDHCSF